MRSSPDNQEILPPVCILAGGLGKRLRPITETIPKPMVEVGGKPFLQHQLEHFAGLGFRHFVLAVSYLWEKIRDHFGDGSAWGWRIEYSVEPSPLGTGGAALLASQYWGEEALVANGDTFLAEDWRRMVTAHRQSGVLATIALTWKEDCSAGGRVEVAEGKVTGFVEKPDDGGGGWVNAGFYVLNRRVFAKHLAGTAFSLEREVFPQWAGQLGAYRCARNFVDIGTWDKLDAFRGRMRQGKEPHG